MEFEYRPHDWGDGYIDQEWFFGIYKIHRIEEHPDNKHRPTYHAYFKPYGWKNWGNRVAVNVPFYQTLEEAQTACAKHAERWPDRPYENDRF